MFFLYKLAKRLRDRYSDSLHLPDESVVEEGAKGKTLATQCTNISRLPPVTHVFGSELWVILFFFYTSGQKCSPMKRRHKGLSLCPHSFYNFTVGQI